MSNVVVPRTREDSGNNDQVNTVYLGGSYTGSFNDFLQWESWAAGWSGSDTYFNMGGHLDPPIVVPASVIELDPPEKGVGWKAVDWGAVYSTYFLPRYNDFIKAYTQWKLSTITAGWNQYDHTSRYYQGSTDDVVVPNFKSRSAAGEVFVNPYTRRVDSLVSEDIEQEDLQIDTSAVGIVFSGITSGKTYSYGSSSRPPGFIDVVATGTWKSTQNHAVVTPAIRSHVFSVLDGISILGNSQNAINDASARIDQAIIDLPVTAAEFGKTVDTIAGAFIKLAKIVSAIKKGKFLQYAPKVFKRMQDDIRKGKFKSYLDYAADAWLEARYAWRPLIYDANNVIKLVKADKQLQPRQTFRGSDVDDDSITTSTSVTDGVYTADVELDIIQMSSHRAGMLCETSFEVALANQLGIFNVATAAWDLVPFSFVVDWFINVGGLLRSLNPNPTFKVIGSWVVSSNYFEVTGTVTYTLPDSSQESTTFRATRLYRERIPDVKATYVNLDIDLDVPKLIDGLSLLIRAKLS